MTKKTLTVIIALLCVCVSSFAESTNVLKFADNLSIKPGQTADIDVILENTTPALHLFCEIELPEGIDPVLNTAGTPAGTMNSERMDGHSIGSFEKTNPHRVRFLITAPDLGCQFKGNSGKILTFSVKASSTYTGGKLKITSKSYMTGDTNIYFDAYEADLKADIPTGEFKLFMNTATVKAGDKADIQLMLDNSIPVNGWYAEFMLPEGIKVTEATIGRKADHKLRYSFKEDTRKLVIFANSEANDGAIKDIPDNAGAVATITIEASSELTAQTLNMQMKNAYVAYDMTTADIENATFQIEVTAADPIGPFSLYMNEPISVKAGETADIQLMLDNGSPVNGWYAVFMLPEGIKVTEATIGRKADHKLRYSFKEDTRKLVIFANSEANDGAIKDIPDNAGAVATITIEASSELNAQTLDVQMKDAYVAYGETTADIENATFHINVTADQVGPFNLYMDEPISVKAGMTANIQLMLDNGTPVNGWYAEFTLPEGIKVTEATIGRTVDHTLRYSFKEDSRKLVIFANSEANDGAIKNIPEDSGAVATITIEAANTFTDDASLSIYMKNAYVAYADTTKDIEDATFQIQLSTGIENIEDSAANNAVIYNLSGQRVSKAAHGIFIQNGKKAVVK